MSCVYTGARVLIESHGCVVPCDLHEVGDVTIIAMPKSMTVCGDYSGKRSWTHKLTYSGNCVWLAESAFTPIIAVLSRNLIGERR